MPRTSRRPTGAPCVGVGRAWVQAGVQVLGSRADSTTAGAPAHRPGGNPSDFRHTFPASRAAVYAFQKKTAVIRFSSRVCPQ